ncbi:hypothetical protein N7645_17555 [Pseudomonas juntendi]|uniref:hypothetical protein n=1 Tax=Pseudomonas juntendi TaxID=2666183 RepID=UPI00244B4F91|nr:hypothetical protein [Pseudomonas juntendi]MDG9918528.1 hypothetical protein [Pseudomonas juntendi]MDH0508136.1 hypothetical protein [Pseudomonas juntendi]MDH1043212.1 hypothetical protein [Pseudomonas juntendi]
MNNSYLNNAIQQAALNKRHIATTEAPMPASFVQFTDSTRMVFERDNQSGKVFAYYQGEWGRQFLDYDFHKNKTLNECMASCHCVAQSRDTMTALDTNQETARLFHLMIQEQGLTASFNQMQQLGVNGLATVGGESFSIDSRHQGIYPYDVISDPRSEMYYERHQDWAHFQLTLAGDAVSFRCKAPPGSRVLGHVWLGRLIRELAAKRLFEIYKADQSKEHLAWTAELALARDLGL